MAIADIEWIERRKAVLRARGVPEKFIDDIARRKALDTRVFLITMLATTPILAVTVLPVLFPAQTEAFLAHCLFPSAGSSLLFYSSDALSAFILAADLAAGSIAIVAIMVVMALRLKKRPVAPSPAFDVFAAFLSRVWPGEDLEAISPDRRLAALDHLPDDAAFLEAARIYRPKEKMQAVWTVLTIAGAGLAMLAAQISDTRTVDFDTMRQHNLQGEHTYSLQDARFAYVLCYDSPDSSPRFDYRIAFPNGYMSIWNDKDVVHGLDEAGILDRIDQIDRHLSELHIPIYRMPETGSPAIDGDTCVTRLGREWQLKSPETLRRLVFG